MFSNIGPAIVLALLGSWPGIRENVVKPLLARLGTIMATALVGWGASAGHAEAFVAGFGALALVVFDLVIDLVNREKAKAKAVARAVGEDLV